MPVEDTPVHPHGIRSAGHRPLCYNAPRSSPQSGYWGRDGLLLDHSAGTTGVFLMKWIPHTLSIGCRQITDLPECEGCTAEKDHAYITKMKELSK